MRTSEKKLKNVRIYDSGEKFIDRYTAVYMDRPEGEGLFDARGMSADPFHPQGFGCSTSAAPGRHLGRRIKFEDCPPDVQKLILQDISEESEDEAEEMSVREILLEKARRIRESFKKRHVSASIVSSSTDSFGTRTLEILLESEALEGGSTLIRVYEDEGDWTDPLKVLESIVKSQLKEERDNE